MSTREYLIDKVGMGQEAVFQGKCHDCKEDVSICVEVSKEGAIKTDHAIWYIEDLGIFAKCDECFMKEPLLTNFRPCEIFSRVCGYLRPVKQYNKGKQEEFKQRTNYKMGGKDGKG